MGKAGARQESGKISTQTDALKSYPYGFGSRFEDDRRGTNPEELLAAAHASCFTMAFSFACDAAGFATTGIDTQAAVRLVRKDGGFLIDRIDLRLEANVPGIDEATFQKLAAGAKKDCPLSKALAQCSRDHAHRNFTQLKRAELPGPAKRETEHADPHRGGEEEGDQSGGKGLPG